MLTLVTRRSWQILIHLPYISAGILKITGIDRVIKMEGIRRIGRNRKVVLNIERRKLQYLAHLMRGQKYTLLQNIIQGKIEGRRNSGRRRMS